MVCNLYVSLLYSTSCCTSWCALALALTVMLVAMQVPTDVHADSRDRGVSCVTRIQRHLIFQGNFLSTFHQANYVF